MSAPTGPKRLAVPRSGSTWRGGAVAVVLSALAMTGCAASPLVEAAEAREFGRLGKDIEAARKAGTLTHGEVQDIARAIAEGEIERAKGEEGEKLILGLAACAEPLEGALDDRSDGDDDVAAAAAGVLLSAGLESEDEFEDYALDNDPRAAFRALGARSLIDPEHAVLRRSLFRDLDERVRLGAVKAALSHPTAGDFDALLEAARLDPNPQARSAAARALGRLGGRRVGLALKDLWLRADGRMREAVAAAWAAPETFEAGGRYHLQTAAESGGEGAVHAALLLARSSALEDASKKARDAALGVLVRAIKVGTREDRSLAILMTPSSDLVLDTIREVKDSGDPGIAVLALSRLAREGKPDEQKSAKDKLVVLAMATDVDAPRAQAELAGLGDTRVVQFIEKELASKNQYARAYAGRNLVTIGQLGRAARLLADKEAQVRLNVACAILAKEL